MYGVSVYTSKDFTLEKNKEYVRKARKYGFNRVFTSFNLPEVNYEERFKEIKELYSFIKNLGMKLSVDISSNVLRLFGVNLNNLKFFSNLGIDCLRLDYGFSIEEIATMTHNEFGLVIELNASTLDESFIKELVKMGADLERLRTCHNFYPKPYTGLSYKDFKKKCKMIKKYDLEIGVFIPSSEMKRGPICEGLPTLEIHRYVNSYTAAKFLIYSGLIDNIYFGDSYAGEEELKKIPKINPEIIEVEIFVSKNILPIEKNILFENIHTNRKDSPEYVIRSVESRGYNKYANEITPHNSEVREKYSITIDNVDFNRYAGELMICRTEMLKDSRVNIVGYVVKDDRILIDLIKPRDKFKFYTDIC